MTPEQLAAVLAPLLKRKEAAISTTTGSRQPRPAGAAVAPALVVALIAALLVGPVPAALAGDVPAPAPTSLTVVGDRLFFTADDGIHGRELWVSDGTLLGTSMVRDIVEGARGAEPRSLAAVGGWVFFSARDGVHGRELWVSDGTTDGTVLVRDIDPTGSSTPTDIADVGGLAYFNAQRDPVGREPFTSDGTSTGTRLLHDLSPGTRDSRTAGFVHFDGATYFGASRQRNNTHGAMLLRHDTTTDELTKVQVWADHRGSFPRELIPIGDLLYLWWDADRDRGRKVLTTDGTPLSVVNLEVTASSAPVPLGGVVSFLGDGNYVRTTDGTVAGTTTVAGPLNPLQRSAYGLTAMGGIGLFASGDGSGGATGIELWRTDGTVAGTTVVDDINAATSSHPRGFTPIGSFTFFDADGGHHDGRELWITDGTAEGTTLVEDINPTDDVGSNPLELIAAGTRVFFVADDGTHGRELWVSDGTEAGTMLVLDIRAA